MYFLCQPKHIVSCVGDIFECAMLLIYPNLSRATSNAQDLETGHGLLLAGHLGDSP